MIRTFKILYRIAMSALFLYIVLLSGKKREDELKEYYDVSDDEYVIDL